MKFNLIPETFNKDQDMKRAEVRPRHMVGRRNEDRGSRDRAAQTEADEQKDTRPLKDKGGQIKEGGLKYKKGFKQHILAKKQVESSL